MNINTDEAEQVIIFLEAQIEELKEARIRWRDRYSSLFNSPHISNSSAQYNIFAEWYQEINDEYKE